VIVVVALLGILLVAAVPQLFGPDELDVEFAARSVATDMELARRFAIARRANFVMTFSPAGGPYASYTLTTGGVAEPDFPKDLPLTVTVTGTASITFRPSGSTTAGATLTFSAGGETAQVTVLAATARVEISGP
jgi:Tfp pilus assembly protein FimT